MTRFALMMIAGGLWGCLTGALAGNEICIYMGGLNFVLAAFELWRENCFTLMAAELETPQAPTREGERT
jgi:hypothetical protein